MFENELECISIFIKINKYKLLGILLKKNGKKIDTFF